MRTDGLGRIERRVHDYLLQHKGEPYYDLMSLEFASVGTPANAPVEGNDG